jgi:hypothetical protein
MRRCRNTWPNPQRSTPGDLFGPKPCATCCTWQPRPGRLLPGLTGSHPRRSPHGRARESNPPGRTRSTRRRLPWPAHTLLSPREPRRESRSPTPCRSLPPSWMTTVPLSQIPAPCIWHRPKHWRTIRHAPGVTSHYPESVKPLSMEIATPMSERGPAGTPTSF